MWQDRLSLYIVSIIVLYDLVVVFCSLPYCLFLISKVCVSYSFYFLQEPKLIANELGLCSTCFLGEGFSLGFNTCWVTMLAYIPFPPPIPGLGLHLYQEKEKNIHQSYYAICILNLESFLLLSGHCIY